MNEELNQVPEQSLGNEASHEHHHHAEKHKAHAEHGHHEKKIDVKYARQEAEIEAKSTEQIKASAGSHDDKPKEEFVGQEAKTVTYQRSLLKIRRHLSPVSRATSKVIHQPLVNAVSDVTGKSVARPSGLLGGGILAFAGTCIYYYYIRHNSLDYNYTVFLVLLFGGFAIGWVAELFYKGFRKGL